MKTKIYTRTGDKGQTSLFTGQRLPKNDPFIEAIGTVDELNCTIGVALAYIGKDTEFKNVKTQLETVQHALFDLGAALATPRTKAAENKLNKTRFDSDGTVLLEKWIDEMEETLPELHTFILPGGNTVGAMLHLARSICRRAERLVVPLYSQSDVSETVLVYLNRLSDYLFVLSRFVNHVTRQPEISWQQHRVSPT